MPRLSFEELQSLIESTIESNVVGAVSAADVRNVLSEILSAIRPAYGVLQQTGSQVQTFSIATPVKVVWNNASDSPAAETVSSSSGGTITRSEKGTSTIQFTMDMEAQNGRFITFTLYKNGVATPWRITGNGGGNGNPIAVSFSAIDYNSVPAVYDVRATAETNGTSVTISNGGLVVKVEPVNIFT